MNHIHVIHENAAWLEPLAAALDRQALPWRDWFFDRGVFDLSQPPPEGVFYNRMTARVRGSAHPVVEDPLGGWLRQIEDPAVEEPVAPGKRLTVKRGGQRL